MPASAVAAGVGGGLSALGSIFGGKGQKKAIKQAAEIQAQAVRDQIAANDRVRAENRGVLNPLLESGQAAGSLLNGVLSGGAGALSAFDTFRNSGNYQFRMNEGLKALNTGYAGKGVLESGAALRGINDYAQNTASNELGSWMDRLYQQQQIGVGAAGALTGQNIQIQGMSNAATQNGADQAANAKLMLGQANANMWSGVASGLGQVAGALGGMGKSSIGGGGALSGITTTLGNSSFKGWL
jgi:hypothetical protein